MGPANLAGLATQGRFTTEVSPAALAGAFCMWAGLVIQLILEQKRNDPRYLFET